MRGAGTTGGALGLGTGGGRSAANRPSASRLGHATQSMACRPAGLHLGTSQSASESDLNKVPGDWMHFNF